VIRPCPRLDDGAVLTEGPALVQYLADLEPESKLAPTNETLEHETRPKHLFSSSVKCTK
jgi:glutathione S-transferase